LKLPIVNAVWIGKKIGRVQAACLRSFLHTGHAVHLYAYGAVDGLPKGVRIKDANTLLPEAGLTRYPNGSFALAANLIRYQMMKRGLGLYVDCDVYCVHPIEDSEVLVGWQDDNYANNAVLKLPPDHPATMELANIAEGWVPPWATEEPPQPLANYLWGTTGPRALTYYLKKHGLVDRILTRDIFYPLHHSQWELLLRPDTKVADFVTPRTRYIHLWNELSKNALLVDRSPLYEMVRVAEMPFVRNRLRRILRPTALP
jgi:hypothetical protein